MSEPDFEVIGDYRFARWKMKAEMEELPRFSVSFWQILVVVLTVILGSARWTLEETKRGNFLPGKIWALGFMGLMTLWPLLALLIIRRKKTPNPVPEAPSHFPRHAIPVLIRLRCGKNPRGRSMGWLWVGGEFLRFEGERFDFRLRPSDFKSEKDLLKRFKALPVGVKVPKKISPSAISIGSEGWDRLAPALEEWLRAPKSSEPSLFPPLRSNVAAASWRFFLRPLAVSVLGGALLGATVYFTMGESLPQGPVPLILGCALYGPLLISSALVQTLANKTYDNEVDRALGKDRGSGKD